MIRTIDYHMAQNVFIFLGLWLFIGAVLLWSPLPGALGIGAEFFGVWVVLLFLITGLGGAMLSLAAINTAFPPAADGTRKSRVRKTPRPSPPPRSDDDPMWAPPPRPSPPQRES